jgi:hypothetical protein
VYWWRSLVPMLIDVIQCGDRTDAFTLFFHFHDGSLSDIATPDELFELIGTLLGRLEHGIADHTIDLDAINPKLGDHHPWRDIAGYAAEAIDAWRKRGCLNTDLHRERAYEFLARLASQPINSSKATETLHRLQAP